MRSLYNLIKKISDEKYKYEIARYCSLTAWVLLSISLLSFRDIGLGRLGLIHDLPFIYFVSLFFSLLSGFLTIGIKHEKHMLQFLNLVFLITALWLVPILFEETPRFASAYKTIGFVEYICREGKLNPLNWELFYHNWPGFSVFTSVLCMFTGNGIIYPLVLYYPFALHLVMLPVLYLIFKQTKIGLTAPNGWYLGAVVYYIANFVNQDYFSPQSFAYYLLSFVILLLLEKEEWFKNCNRAIAYKIIIMLIFVTIAVSHILSSLVALTMFGAFCIFEKQTFRTMLLFSIVVVLAWTIYGASVYFDTHTAIIIRDLFMLEKSWNANIGNRIKGSPEHITVNKIRFFYAASFAFISFIGLISSIKKVNRKVLLDLAKVSSVSVCVTSAFVYGGESFMRAYLLMLVPMSIFCMMYLYHKKLLPLLLLICITALPFHVIAHYGNEEVDYVRLSIIHGSDFLAKYCPDGYTVGHEGILGNTRYTERFITLTWEQCSQEYFKNKTENNFYFSIGPWEHSFHTLFYNDLAFVNTVEVKMKYDKNYTLFYDNGEIKLYHTNTNIF
jgi:hypothetical protein